MGEFGVLAHLARGEGFDSDRTSEYPLIRPVGHLLPLARGRRDFGEAVEYMPINPGRRCPPRVNRQSLVLTIRPGISR